MGRPRKSTHHLNISGAFKNHPERRREDPETTGDIGEPPDHLTKSEKENWRELVDMALPGVLAKQDRIALEMATCLLNELRADAQNFTAAKYARLEALLGRFGMTPADRSRVSTRLPSKANLFANNGRQHPYSGR